MKDKAVFALTSVAKSYNFGDTDLTQYGIHAYEDGYYRIYIFDFSTDAWKHME